MISESVKGFLLSYAPVVEDRTYFLGNNEKSSVIDININLEGNESCIYFMKGNNHYRSNTGDYIKHDKLINIDEIISIIDFIVKDMDTISEFNIHQDRLFLAFRINWSNKTIKGMSCNKILMNIRCKDLHDKKYQHILLKQIILHFKDYISRCQGFKVYMDKYLTKDKIEYFSSMSREELLEKVNMLDSDTIKSMLINMDNEDYYNYFYASSKIKKLNN